MALEEILSENPILQGMLGGAFMTFILASLAVALVIGLAAYIYFALAWMIIGKKLNYKYPWLAWIPIANMAMVLQLGGFAWPWIFLVFVPVLGWIALFVMGIIACWKVFEKRKYPGWLSLLVFIPKVGIVANAIVIGFVAWKDRK